MKIFVINSHWVFSYFLVLYWHDLIKCFFLFSVVKQEAEAELPTGLGERLNQVYFEIIFPVT